jgi:pimeloyl-ACP methyl ester carboxylesterase
VRPIVGALCVIVAAGCGSSKEPVPVADMHCAGNGAPTIVLESGLDQGEAAWSSLRPDLEKLGRVCSYDRPGIGASSALPEDTARTVSDEVASLDDALDAAHVEPPYVLVGHSWGGAIVQLYATKHGDDVAGIVLVDSSHADTIRDWLAALPPAPSDDVDPYSGVRGLLVDSGKPTANHERIDRDRSVKALHDVDLPEVPLVVLTAAATSLAPAVSGAVGKKISDVWLDEQNELAGMSDHSVHALARLSGHFMMNDQPDLVVAAIRAVENAARNGAELPACRALFRGLAARCL